MANETTYAGILGSWRQLLEPIAANSEELRHLGVPRDQLEALLAQAVALNKEQAAYRAAKQERSKQLRALLQDGAKVAALLRKGVQVHYGTRAEKLTEFGLQPYRGRRRAPRTAPEPGASEPSSTSAGHEAAASATHL
jgi:hypothetical protein